MFRPWVSLKAIQNMGNRSISSSNRCTLRSCRRTLTTASTTPFRSKISSHVPQRQPHRHRYTPKPSRRHHEHPSRQPQHHPPPRTPTNPTTQASRASRVIRRHCSRGGGSRWTGNYYRTRRPRRTCATAPCNACFAPDRSCSTTGAPYAPSRHRYSVPSSPAMADADTPDATGPAHTATPTPPSAPPKQASTRSRARRRGDPADRLRRSRDGRRLRCRIVAG